MKHLFSCKVQLIQSDDSIGTKMKIKFLSRFNVFRDELFCSRKINDPMMSITPKKFGFNDF